MTIDSYDFVHLALYAKGGRIQGKTKLQKTMYFLGVMTECLDDLGYRAHFYGPYSEEVADAMGQLCSLGFVTTTSSVWGVDARGFEMTRTIYCLSEDGKSIAESKSRQNPELWKKIKDAVKLMNRAGDLDYMKLSVAAKTFFVLGQKDGSASLEDLVALANKFGWKVTEDQVTDAARFLKRLDLVRVAESYA
jgi:uncharacterized protein YwgA